MRHILRGGSVLARNRCADVKEPSWGTVDHWPKPRGCAGKQPLQCRDACLASMAMRVRRVGNMGMGMTHWLVLVPMTVLPHRHHVVCVNVMSVVVAVRMFVLQRLVRVSVDMRLREMQHHPGQHQRAAPAGRSAGSVRSRWRRWPTVRAWPSPTAVARQKPWPTHLWRWLPAARTARHAGQAGHGVAGPFT